MSRPKRRKLKFDEESANALMQEIYVDSHNIRAKIARLFTKWETQITEKGEFQALGETIAKLIVAEAKTVDQKLVLLRYLKEVVFAKEVKGEDTGNKGEVSKEERNNLIKQVAMQVNKG